MTRKRFRSGRTASSRARHALGAVSAAVAMVVSLASWCGSDAVAAPHSGGTGSGRDVGNGGHAVVCRNADGSIASTELLDLFEGAALYGLDIRDDGFAEEMLVEIATHRLAALDRDFYERVEREVDVVRSRLVQVPRGVTLVWIDDAFPVALPRGCGLEQLAVYAWDGNVYVNPEIFGATSGRDRAALLLHEAIYKVARDEGGLADSRLARRLNAHLFADSSTDPSLERALRDLLAAFAPDILTSYR